MTRAVPLLAGLAGFRPEWLRQDIPAGLAIAAVGLPSAVAYPAIAGLPPETGLYASIASVFGYALLGPSRRLIAGPDAATMTVLASVIAGVVASASEGGGSPAAIAAAMALAVGACCLLARVLGLGAIASFLSRPILAGFFAGIALSIVVGQLGRITGLDIDADGLVPPLVEALRETGDANPLSLATAAACFATVRLADAWRSPVPGPVIAIVGAAALSALLDFRGMGVAVIGDVEAGLPPLGLPAVSGLPWGRVLVDAGAIFLVSFGAGIVTARSFGVRTGERVDPSAELVGFGAANIASGLCGGFPVTASDSRTAINLSIGGHSQAAGIVSGLVLLAAILFLGPAISVVPQPALGAILVAAALSLIDLGALREVWRVSRIEFAFALIALAGAVGFGVLQGVVVAAAATLVYVLHASMRRRVALLGRVPGRPGFYKLHREPLAVATPGLAIALVEGDVLFFNADAVDASLRARFDDAAAAPDWLILDASAIALVDVTGAMMLDELARDLHERGVRLAIADAHAPALARLARAGLVARIGPDMVFPTLDAAVAAFDAARPAPAPPANPPGAAGGSGRP
ncbi:SulP family inorganic anion transporter [Amaricoccus sp.]|uniref:SulP family inorganic anion transporter n=1 Tax=Amaricoccus sp. TaxID=1872485 RepID=UPI001B7A69BC|nr:SulP family inorganic anion transporter [Amaricoccus sp.]MBP7003689.1 SulP family inorganic anion transporter [Amaricoccus sp.]